MVTHMTLADFLVANRAARRRQALGGMATVALTNLAVGAALTEAHTLGLYTAWYEGTGPDGLGYCRGCGRTCAC